MRSRGGALMMTSTPAERLERLEFAQHLLQRRGAYIAAAVLRLGKVTFDNSIATAAILAKGPNVKLFFNEHFLDKINNFELAAVLIHEALHFVFKHQERVAQL